MPVLGTLEELPKSYCDDLTSRNLVPLWPALRSFLPYEMPERKCTPAIWRYPKIRPLLLQACDLTPIEKAERRVPILANPSLDPATARATSCARLGIAAVRGRAACCFRRREFLPVRSDARADVVRAATVRCEQRGR
jgi:gentisate 1,2-dioxygenase